MDIYRIIEGGVVTPTGIEVNVNAISADGRQIGMGDLAVTNSPQSKQHVT